MPGEGSLQVCDIQPRSSKSKLAKREAALRLCEAKKQRREEEKKRLHDGAVKSRMDDLEALARKVTPVRAGHVHPSVDALTAVLVLRLWIEDIHEASDPTFPMDDAVRDTEQLLGRKKETVKRCIERVLLQEQLAQQAPVQAAGLPISGPQDAKSVPLERELLLSQPIMDHLEAWMNDRQKSGITTTVADIKLHLYADESLLLNVSRTTIKRALHAAGGSWRQAVLLTARCRLLLEEGPYRTEA